MDEIQSIGLVAWKYQADGGLGTGAMKHGNFTLLAKWGWSLQVYFHLNSSEVLHRILPFFVLMPSVCSRIAKMGFS
ncbi:hypothetical protein SDJN03_22728, partial [Cucurbita argyrosperma subsp. sororia]